MKLRFLVLALGVIASLAGFARESQAADGMRYFSSAAAAREACTSHSIENYKGASRYGCPPEVSQVEDMTYFAKSAAAQEACTSHSIENYKGASRYGCPPEVSQVEDITYFAKSAAAQEACTSHSIKNYKGASRYGCPPEVSQVEDMTYFAKSAAAQKACTSHSIENYKGAGRYGCVQDFSWENGLIYFAKSAEASKACTSHSIENYKGASRYGCPPRLTIEGLVAYFALSSEARRACVNVTTNVLRGAQRYGCRLPGPVPSLLSLNGEVKVLGKDGKTKPVGIALLIAEGDRILTQPRSFIQFRLPDDARVSVAPLSQLNLDRYQFTAGACNRPDSRCASQFNLSQGSAHFVTGSMGKDKPESVVVKAPSGFVGIRGTDFDVVEVPASSQDGMDRPGIYVRVTSGKVYLKNAKGHVDVAANQVGYAAASQEAPVLLSALPATFARGRTAP